MRKILTLIFLLSATILFSQVGIQTMNPSPLTELDIKNKIVNGDTIPKGILIPRMTLKQRNAINVTDPKAANSLLIYNTDEDCYNYYNRTAGEWSSLCGKLGKAQFGPVDCGTVSVTGQYLTKTALSSQNYITLTVTVTKPGSYVIKAMPATDNGYYFYTSGEFLQTGTFVITVPAAGTPQNAKNPDLIDVVINDVKVCSGVKVTIEDSSIKPNFTMDCEKVVVSGVYQVNSPVTSTNYMTITLNVNSAAIGSTFIVKTNTVDGLSFSGTSMIISSPSQTIRLDAYGTPTSLGDKLFTITSNSATSVATCAVKVTVAISLKKILAIGSGALGYDVSYTGSPVYKMIKNLSNFGLQESSTVKSQGFTFSNTPGYQPSETQLKADLDNKPDIVIIGYSWGPNSKQAQYLADYLAKGGVIIAFTENSLWQEFLQTVFNNASVTFASGTSNPAGSVYQFTDTNDEVINGPFGDLRGLQWGEDASATSVVGNIPAGSATVYSTDTNLSLGPVANTGKVTAFRHNSLNLIFIGDGGFNSGDAGTSNTICPFKADAANKPIPKAGYGYGTPKFSVYNSIFTANALAWALKRAEFNGINSVK